MRPLSRSGWPVLRGTGRLAECDPSSGGAEICEQLGPKIDGSSQIRPVGMLALEAVRRGDIEL